MKELKQPAQAHRVASTGLPAPNPYLAAQIRHILETVDSESNPKTREKILLRLKELARDLRNFERGFAYWQLAFTCVLVIAAVFYLRSLRVIGYTYSAPDNYFHVLEKISDYEFVLQRVEKGRALVPLTYHFCRDYKPLFQAGMSLTWFSYDDRGSCQSIGPAYRGYVIDRGPDHWPLLAKNCRHSESGIVCVGRPKFD